MPLRIVHFDEKRPTLTSGTNGDAVRPGTPKHKLQSRPALRLDIGSYSDSGALHGSGIRPRVHFDQWSKTLANVSGILAYPPFCFPGI
jgi:hypothetical protein